MKVKNWKKNHLKQSLLSLFKLIPTHLDFFFLNYMYKNIVRTDLNYSGVVSLQ